MAITLASAARTAMLTAVGTGLTSGKLGIYLANGTTQVATLSLNTGGGNALDTETSPGVRPFKAITADSNATGNTGSDVAVFIFFASNGTTEWYRGSITVTGNGGDITIASLRISPGAVVSAGTITVTVPAS